MSVFWCSFVHVFQLKKGKCIHPPAGIFVRGMGLLMAVRKNQPLVPRHFVASENSVQEPPAETWAGGGGGVNKSSAVRAQCKDPPPPPVHPAIIVTHVAPLAVHPALAAMPRAPLVARPALVASLAAMHPVLAVVYFD